MFFKERNEELPQNNTEDISTDVESSTTVENNKTLSGINALSNDMTSMLKKVVSIYSKTMDLRTELAKKSDISKGAITQNDIQSIIKIMTQDINIYLSKVNNSASQLKKSYLELENKINVILVSNDRDEEFTASFNRFFFYKTLSVYVDKYLQENIDSGVFLICLYSEEEKSKAFVKNKYKAVLNNIYSELRYLDVVAHISDTVFAVLIADVSQGNFEFMLKQIIKKTKSDNIEQAVSAGMIGKFDNAKLLIKILEDNLKKVKRIQDDYIFA